jgi:hypothetical protein
MSWNAINPFPNGVQTVSAGSNITVSGTVTNPVISASAGSGLGSVYLDAWSSAKSAVVVPNTIYHCLPNNSITLNASATAWSNGNVCWILNYNPGGAAISFVRATGTTNFFGSAYLIYDNNTFFYVQPTVTAFNTTN